LSGHAGLNYNYLISKLEKLGYKKGNINDPFVNFVFIELQDLKYDKKAFYIKSDIKSLIDNKENLIDKRKLYFSFDKNIRNKYFAKTTDIKDFNYENFPVILRPIGGFAGKDIFIPESKLDFNIAMKNLKQYNHVIVSEYIQNPMLIENKKFHIRILFMIKVGFGSPNVSIFKRGLIMTAEEDYKNSNFENKKIHDTHAKSTFKQMYYPEDYPGLYIQDQIEEVLMSASKTISPKKFPETKRGFEVFGADILVTDNNKIILMEVNDKIGFKPITKEHFDNTLGPWSDHYSKFSDEYYQWIIDSVFPN